jgi:hypothetical protein
MSGRSCKNNCAGGAIEARRPARMHRFEWDYNGNNTVDRPVGLLVINLPRGLGLACSFFLVHP